MRILTASLTLVLGVACSGEVTAPTPVATSTAPVQTVAITGTVHDTIGRPIRDARVEVQEGPQRGLAVSTNDTGTYALDAIVDRPVMLRASKAGYTPQTISVAHPRAARHFRLDSANGSVSFQGRFTLTFAADAACTQIPAYARRRSYEATSGGSASMYLITLAGGGYELSGVDYFSNVLYGGVFEDIAQVNLSDPPIWERFTQGSYLVIHGGADGSIRQLPATLPMWGHFTYCADMVPGTTAPTCAVPEVSCQSSNHRLTIDTR